MHRWILPIVLSLGLTGISIAKTRCVCCVDSCSHQCIQGAPAPPATVCDDVQPAATCRSLKPSLCTPQVANVAEPDARLHSFLKRWTDAARDISEVRASFKSTEHDNVFQVKRVGEGDVGIRPGDRGWYRLRGTHVDQHAKPVEQGKEYAVQPLKPEQWYFTDEFIYSVNIADKTFEKKKTSWEIAATRIQSGVTPTSIQDWLVVWPHNMLSSQFLMPPALVDLQVRFEIELVKEDDSHIQLRLTPRRQLEQLCAQETRVIVDKSTLHTLAVQRMGREGSRYVNVFRDHQVLRSGTQLPAMPIPDLNTLRLVEIPKSTANSAEY